MSTSNAAHNAAQGYDFDDEFELEFGDKPAPLGMQPVAPVAPVQPVLLEGDINPREPLPMTAVAPAAASFNPVGDLMAGAQSALAPYCRQHNPRHPLPPCPTSCRRQPACPAR